MHGGLTTKLHAAVDASGLPLRVQPTPGHRGDCPQAEGLLAGLSGVSRVIADADYKERHQVECFFNRLKRFRRIALRCEKTPPAFTGFVHLACAMIWLE